MKLVHRCWHCFLTLFIKILMTIYFKKGLIFYLFSDFHQNFSESLEGLPKLLFPLLDESFMQRKFSLREKTFYYVFFNDLDQLFSKTFVKNSVPNCWKFFQRVTRTLLRNFVTESSGTSIFVWHSAANLLTFQQNVVVRTAIYLSRWKTYWLFFL